MPHSNHLGGAGTGKTKAVLLPILKCLYNSINIMYDAYNKKLLGIAQDIKEDHNKKNNTLRYVLENWKTPRIGIFAGSQRALSEIIDTIMTVNKIKYFASFQRYSEIPIQRIGNETINCLDGLSFDHFMIHKQSQNICHIVHNLCDSKWDKNGKPKMDASTLQPLMKLSTSKKTVRASIKLRLFEKIMKLPAGDMNNKTYQEIEYLIKKIKLLKTEIICLSIIRNNNFYEDAQKKLVQVLMNQSKVIFAVPDTIGMFAAVTDFDYGLFDESNQMTEAETLIALRYCKRAALFGDVHGLKAKVLQSECLATRSLFCRLRKYIQPVVLDEQYRMHPEISEFPEKFTYGGKLSDCLRIEFGLNKRRFHEDELFPPYLFCDVKGVVLPMGDSFINQRECNHVKQVLEELMQIEEYMKEIKNIGIITPYESQKLLIIQQFEEEFKLMRDEYKVDVKCGGVDEFQGSQKDIIIISCVYGNDNHEIAPALSDPSCINVMLTRCKSALWIFGNSECLSSASMIWKNLIENAIDRACFVK